MKRVSRIKPNRKNISVGATTAILVPETLIVAQIS